MFLLKTITTPTAVLCLFAACNNMAAKTPSPPVKPDSAAVYARALPPISAADSARYHDASERFFDSLLPARSNFNGSILVAKNGHIVYEKYTGYVNPADRETPLTPHSAFQLASVSKTFTAMAVLKLWQDGKLGLEDSLRKFFPEFPYSGITVKMLLSHRSGLPNYVHYLDRSGWDKNKLVSNTEVLSSLYTLNPPLEFVSGKHFSYCNTNYALLALVVEKTCGKPFPQYLQDSFFTPLRMNDTYVFSLKDTARAMPSFEWNNREFGLEFLDQVYGDKNVYSTVQDMLKWDQALYAGKLFKQATLDSAFAGYSFEKEGKRNYGLGWRMTFIDNGKKLLYHNGWWHGNNTVFIRLVDENATVIVLGNRFNRRIYSAKYIADLFGDYRQKGRRIDESETTGGGEPGHSPRHHNVKHYRRHR
jgi:CubicO group peptidase (beta-lactamase class C family)